MALLGIFYHLLGLGLSILISLLEISILGELEQQSPAVLTFLIFAGPIEETLFFGIPYYLTGNYYVTLGAAVFWSLMHLFNMESGVPSLENLTYANFVFTIPVLFYSFRLWISGKGWFSILTHSIWNVFIFVIITFEDQDSWQVFGPGGFDDMSLLIISAILLLVNYVLFRWKNKRKNMKTPIH